MPTPPDRRPGPGPAAAQAAAGLPGPAPGIAFAGIGDEAGSGLHDQLSALDRLGWRCLELRTVAGQAVADLDDRAFAGLAAELDARGVAVCCLDSRIGNWARPVTADFDADLRELEVLAARCAALGTNAIRIMTYPNDGLAEPEWRRRAVERVRRLCAVAESRGVVLLAENCAGWAAERAERMLDLLDAAGPALGLLFDTGNGVAHGYGPPALLSDIADRVAHVHVKDALPATGGGEPAYTAPGEGRAGVAACLRMLVERGYRGVWSIEPHLSLHPHRGSAAGTGDADGFVAAGEALRRLAAEAVAAAAGTQATGAGAPG
ncbi:sugar phosphate isomerase/epimerase family protein [Streptomonospora wellingtoniae]|uniref:Sugar phosphate isomerase/epimerase family protein n=1 Tax=Streptomonospora wellingtoniae TaxID=3075544 RepID=A0ABU2KQL9_9ACTN|nr:sugar phosphate isomerase/epimerase family protein [Streptomonospora sp. DSM 45055]MDT0301418.1 sugar phosphate isomerase/epimerase family protein [Streptomonospora sp. DSM 45055]